jgi:succinyl-diaminopimelate desuccinylase
MTHKQSELITTLSELIAIPSVSGHETAIIAHIAGRLAKMGYAPDRVGGNLVLTIPGRRRDRAVVLNSHVDTVPAGNPADWHHDPCAAAVSGGKVYGLGASDEKAAVAVLLQLAKRYAADPPPCDVILMFVVNEEVDGSGSREAVGWFSAQRAARYDAIGAVLGEPTGLSRIEIAHRGNVFVRLTTTGDAGHGSRPQAVKVHAVKRMLDAVARIELMADSWKTRYADPVLGVPTVGVLTSIAAGRPDSPNVFPSSCTATCDVRTVPAMHSSVIQLIRQSVGSIATVEMIGADAPPGYTDPSAPIVRAAVEATAGSVTVADYSTDLTFFTRAGIPGVILGPGERSAMHAPDEYCPVGPLDACPGVYESIVAVFSAAGPGGV